MPLFDFHAIADGSRINGTLAADSPRAARDQLRDRGLRVLRLDSVAPPRAANSGGRSISSPQHRLRSLLADRGVPRSEVTDALRELATLVGVGMPLEEALGVAAAGRGRRAARALYHARDRVAAGAPLAEAMAQQPGAFDELCVQVVRVGEAAGTLDVALARLAEFRERQRRMRGRLTTALLYPGIVAGMAVLVTLFLMTFVVPNIVEPLEEMGRELPWPTRVVKGASDLLVARWWLLALITVGTVATVIAVLQTNRGRLAWHQLLLRLPLVGTLIRKQAVVQVATTMSALLASGVVFIDALRAARRGTRNAVLVDALTRAERAVENGADVAEALGRTNAFPPLVAKVFALGQESGRLEETLARLAADYDEQVDVAAQRTASALEPLMIVLLSLVVLLIALATMLPILEAGNVT